MAKKKPPKPTEAELAILHVLWDLGKATVREVQEQLSAERQTGYTTTLKLMQIMLKKGWLHRDDSQHAHVYSAAFSRQATQRRIVRDLMKTVFGGSAQQLVMQALSAKRSTPSELREIRKLLDKLERDQR